MKQGELYIKEDADKWFERNKGIKHNYFTEYLMALFSKQKLANMDLAEFGIGRANNINLLSHYVKHIDGYDGALKSIKVIDDLSLIRTNIDGKRVNLGDKFDALRKYDLIIFGFFTYMLSDDEFQILVKNSFNLLNNKGYIYIYDFFSTNNKVSTDSHNKTFKIHKRNFNFYIDNFKNFNLIDFRLSDNQKLKEYLFNDNICNIDTKISDDDYNWTFSMLFQKEDI